MKETTPKRAKIVCLPLVVVCALLIGSTLVGAQVPSDDVIVAAPPENCAADDKGEDILTGAKNLSESVCNSSAIATSDSTGFFTPMRRAQLTDQCERSRAWVNAEGRASDFAKMGKKRSADCYIEEILDDGIGNDDGICTQAEKNKGGCAENDEDNIGNNDGVCEKIKKGSQENARGNKKNVWEECLEVCDTTDDNPEVTDCTTMDQMAGSLQDAADAIDSTNAQISARLEELAALQRQASNMASVANVEDPCARAATVSVGDFDYEDGSRAHTYDFLAVALGAAETLKIVADVCTDALDTTALVDYRMACGVAHVAEGIASTLATETELLDDAITGARIDNATLCLETLKAGQDQLNDKLDTIIELLYTPQGRRPLFPNR